MSEPPGKPHKSNGVLHENKIIPSYSVYYILKANSIFKFHLLILLDIAGRYIIRISIL